MWISPGQEKNQLRLAAPVQFQECRVERSQVMAWNNFSTWIGGTAISLIALTFFFKATPEYPRGLLNPEPYLPFSLLAAASWRLVTLRC